MDYTRNLPSTSPLTRGICTWSQSSYSPVLMALAGTIEWFAFARINRGKGNWTPATFIRFNSEFRPPSRIGSSTSEQVVVRTMPRLQRKSRRGAAWYRAESRRKRIQQFERALAMAATRCKRKPKTPPMAIVEEISWEEAQLHLPSLVSTKATKPLHGKVQWDLNEATEEDLFPTCIVEEEAPPAIIPAIVKTAGSAPSTPGESGTGLPNVNEEVYQPPASDSRYLPLIFELRHLIEDHAFRLAQMDQ